MKKPSLPRLPSPNGPAPCPRGDPPNPICQLKGERKCLCRPPACHLQKCSRLTTCQWTWSTAWPQRGHPVGGTTA